MLESSSGRMVLCDGTVYDKQTNAPVLRLTAPDVTAIWARGLRQDLLLVHAQDHVHVLHPQSGSALCRPLYVGGPLRAMTAFGMFFAGFTADGNVTVWTLAGVCVLRRPAPDGLACFLTPHKVVVARANCVEVFLLSSGIQVFGYTSMSPIKATHLTHTHATVYTARAMYVVDLHCPREPVVRVVVAA